MLVAEFLAQKYKISRQDQDNFALKSQTKTKQSMEMGYFDKEIVNVPVGGKQINNIDEDEYPKKGTTLEDLSVLRPVFSGVSNLYDSLSLFIPFCRQQFFLFQSLYICVTAERHFNCYNSIDFVVV